MAIVVLVQKNNLDAALRLFNKKVKLTKLMYEIQQRSFFEKPSVKKRRKHLSEKHRQQLDQT